MDQLTPDQLTLDQLTLDQLTLVAVRPVDPRRCQD